MLRELSFQRAKSRSWPFARARGVGGASANDITNGPLAASGAENACTTPRSQQHRAKSFLFPSKIIRALLYSLVRCLRTPWLRQICSDIGISSHVRRNVRPSLPDGNCGSFMFLCNGTNGSFSSSRLTFTSVLLFSLPIIIFRPLLVLFMLLFPFLCVHVVYCYHSIFYFLVFVVCGCVLLCFLRSLRKLALIFVLFLRSLQNFAPCAALRDTRHAQNAPVWSV